MRHGTDEYNGANDLSMFPLSVPGRSLLYTIVGVPVIAVVLLLAYPIPFKYDFSLPYVSKSLFTASGFLIGAMIYMYLVYDKHKSHARDCNPVSSGIMHLVFSCLHNVNECFEAAGLYNKKGNNPGVKQSNFDRLLLCWIVQYILSIDVIFSYSSAV